MKTVRHTFSISEQLASDIKTVSKGLGVSQSAFISNVLSDTVHDMANVVRQFKQLGETPQAALRLRGESVDKVSHLYTEFMEAMDRLDRPARGRQS